MKNLTSYKTRKNFNMAPRRQQSLVIVATISTVLAVITSHLVHANPSYQPNLRYTANDLYPSPAEVPTAAYKSLVAPTSASFQNDNQQQPTFKSGPRAVINGNHATYVEPPADFKPIIYEPERQEVTQQKAVAASSAMSSADRLAESSNQPVPSRLTPATISGQHHLSSRQQQKRQTEAPPTMPMQELPENQIIRAHENRATSTDTASIESAASADEELNSLPMKPSIDRWSDWTDMSVDPDLASSDTQLSPVSASIYSKQNQHNSAVSSSPGVRHVGSQRWQTSRVQPQKQFDLEVHQQRNHINLIKTSAQVNDQTSSSSSRFVPLNVHARPQEQMYSAPLAPPSATGNLIKMQPNSAQDYQFYQASQLPMAQSQLAADGGEALSYHSPPRVVARPVYYILPQQYAPFHNIQTGPVEQQRYDSFARSSFIASDSTPHVMMPLLAAPPPPPHTPMLLQRYGKKMANLFKAADNQHHPMSLGNGGLKRLYGLKRPTVAQQNAEVRRAGFYPSEGHRLSSPLVQLSSGQSSSGIDTSAHLGKRVSVGGIPAINRVITPASNHAQGQRNLLKQNSNSTVTPPKRVLKRRRIKTLVPVGLSSWFLGGIRDLDARHWKLPADVISKLAINDVDLAHSEQPTPFVGAPASQDELVNMSNQVQAGGSLEKADSPRASTTRSPTSQPLSPR